MQGAASNGAQRYLLAPSAGGLGVINATFAMLINTLPQTSHMALQYLSIRFWILAQRRLVARLEFFEELFRLESYAFLF